MYTSRKTTMVLAGGSAAAAGTSAFIRVIALFRRAGRLRCEVHARGAPLRRVPGSDHAPPDPVQNFIRHKSQRPHLAHKPPDGFLGHLRPQASQQRRLPAHERPLSPHRLHQAHPLHLPVRSLYRVGIDPSLQRQIPLRRNAITRLQLAPGDGPLELVDDLLVDGPFRIKAQPHVVYPRSARASASLPRCGARRRREDGAAQQQ